MVWHTGDKLSIITLIQTKNEGNSAALIQNLTTKKDIHINFGKLVCPIRLVFGLGNDQQTAWNCNNNKLTLNNGKNIGVHLLPANLGLTSNAIIPFLFCCIAILINVSDSVNISFVMQSISTCEKSNKFTIFTVVGLVRIKRIATCSHIWLLTISKIVTFLFFSDLFFG